VLPMLISAVRSKLGSSKAASEQPAVVEVEVAE